MLRAREFMRRMMAKVNDRFAYELIHCVDTPTKSSSSSKDSASELRDVPSLLYDIVWGRVVGEFLYGAGGECTGSRELC